MTSNCECNIEYIPYKEIVKQKVLEYYHKNKEKNKIKKIYIYNSLTLEEKKKRQEQNKEWFKKEPSEK